MSQMKCELLRVIVTRQKSCFLEHHPWYFGIKGTSDDGITFQRGSLACVFLEVFADPDYASKATDRRSVSGGAIVFDAVFVC